MEDKAYDYVRGMLEGMVRRRAVTTLGRPRAQASHLYVNPVDPPTAEEKAKILAERKAHSRFES